MINTQKYIGSYAHKILILAMAMVLFSACENERASLNKTCYQVMSKDAVDGAVKIYDTGQAMPRETCSCFSKMQNSDDRLKSQIIFYDLMTIQKRDNLTADKVFDALVRQIQQDGQIRTYGINNPGGSVGPVYKLKSKINEASRIAGAGRPCKKSKLYF